MSMVASRPSTPPHLLNLAQSLTMFAAAYDLTPERNVIVYCFDASYPEWADDPAAWFDPQTSQIVINLGTIWQSIYMRKGPDHFGIVSRIHEESFTSDDKGVTPINKLVNEVCRIINGYTKEANVSTFSSFDTDGSFSKRTIASWHDNLRYILEVEELPAPESTEQAIVYTLLAVLLHETGHSVFSKALTTAMNRHSWTSSLSWYETQILMILEELRSERQQIARVGLGAQLLRYAADVVISPEKIVEDLRKSGTDKGVNAPALALSISLCSGRALYGVFTDEEVMSLNQFAEASLGKDRFAAMTSIWRDYSSIVESNEVEMKKCLDRWVEIFPEPHDDNFETSTSPISKTRGEHGYGFARRSKKKDSTTSPSTVGSKPSEDKSDDFIDFSGVYDEITDKISHAVHEAQLSPADLNDSARVRRSKPLEAYRSSVTVGELQENPRFQPWISISKPSSHDYELSNRLVHDILEARLSARLKISTKNEIPPGRIDMREAMQSRADNAAGRYVKRELFKRRRYRAQHNPMITVAVLTDVSSSHAWATEFNARMTFIVCSAVKRLNGRAVAVTFGDRATLVLSPNEYPSHLVTIKARDSTEEFDIACGTADYLLGLTRNTADSIKIVFVITDGDMVKTYEMRKTAEWVADMTRAGCLVIWISPFTHEYTNYADVPLTPPGAVLLHVDKATVRKDPTSAVESIADTLRRHVIDRVYR